jgi:hypothetical protein
MYVPHLTRSLELPGPARSAEPVWVTPHGVRPEIRDLERVSPVTGYFLVHDWVAEPHLFEGVEAMFLSVGGEVVAHPVTAGDRTDPIIAAFLDERLWLWRVPIPAVPAPAVFPERPKSEPPPDKPAEVLTWIEVRLADDEEGSPVADEPVEVIDRDGRVYPLRTNEEGLVRVDAILNGVCEISFPKIDGREWARLGGSYAAGSDVVARTHVVQARECMARIAYKFGFRSGATLWTHPCNEPIRAQKREPNLLWPGDRIHILERDRRVEEAATGKRHEYMVKKQTRWLRLVLHDIFRDPLASTLYELRIPGMLVITRTTNGSGLLEEPIPPWATEAEIICGDYRWSIVIADVLPVRHAPDEGKEGALRRLRNLGCPADRPDRDQIEARRHELASSGDTDVIDPAFDADVWMHQLRVGWPDSGELDEATERKIVKEYGL